VRVPILRNGGILLTSFQDDMTDRDAHNLQIDLLEMIAETGDEAVLMDVTSMQTIDSYQAKMISDTAAMARLLGCEVVLTGIQPMVALTLVELGDVVSDIRTVLNIEKGLALLQESVSKTDNEEDDEEEIVDEVPESEANDVDVAEDEVSEGL
jgi:rsbT antagonist protein RsbS